MTIIAGVEAAFPGSSSFEASSASYDEWIPVFSSLGGEDDAYDYDTAQFCAGCVRQVYQTYYDALDSPQNVFPEKFQSLPEILIQSPTTSDPLAAVGGFIDDDDRLCIVVAFRGTTNVDDWKYNLNLKPVTNPWSGNPKDGVVHGGFLRYYAYDSTPMYASAAFGAWNQTFQGSVGDWSATLFLWLTVLIAAISLLWQLMRGLRGAYLASSSSEAFNDDNKPQDLKPFIIFTCVLFFVSLVMGFWLCGDATQKDALNYQNRNTDSVAALVRAAVDDIQKAAARVAPRASGTKLLNITVTGHSLGATFSQMTTIDLARKYPTATVHCYAFAPPRMGDEFFNVWLHDSMRFGSRTSDARRMFSFVAFDDIVSLVPPPSVVDGLLLTVPGHMYMVNAQSAGGGIPHFFWNDMHVCSGTTFQDATYAARKKSNSNWWEDHTPGRCANGGFNFIPCKMIDNRGNPEPSWEGFLRDVGWRYQNMGATTLVAPTEERWVNPSVAWERAFKGVTVYYLALGFMPVVLYVVASLASVGSMTGNASCVTFKNAFDNASNEGFRAWFLGATLPYIILAAWTVSTLNAQTISFDDYALVR